MGPFSINHQRRYTLPFISRSLNAYLDDEEEAAEFESNINRRHKIYKYKIPIQDLENERPFMAGRKEVPEDEKPDLPLPTPIHVREILSDEEMENERPFMRGRVKVPREVLKARLESKWAMSKVLSDKEWENEAPFMHGRNPISAEEQKTNFIQMSPMPSTLERENERPFMKGRKHMRKIMAEQRRERRLIELLGDDYVEPQTETENQKVGKRVKANFQKQKEGRRLCPPCRAINEFRKAKLVPAVKSVHGFLTGQTGYTFQDLVQAQKTQPDVKQSQKIKKPAQVERVKTQEKKEKVLRFNADSDPIFNREVLKAEFVELAEYRKFGR